MPSGQGFTSLPYKNAKLPIDERVEDLLNRMTLAEKAGQMFHNMFMIGPGGSLLTEPNEAFGIPAVETLVGEKLMSHFNLVGLVTVARETAQWQNRMQERAKATRLGIPVTISTDPRNHFTDNVGTGFQAGVLSQWPDSLGLAAIRSSELVERFANVARQEYLALGIRLALHPQIDLATEPRWARIGRTFGEDADLSSELVAAYIRGFQGPELGPNSVSIMTKHFPGGGPEKDGEDSHFIWQRTNYSMPVDTEFEEVGFAFNKGIITGLLRESLKFTGIVCTDWGLVTDATILGQNMPARACGVEHLSGLDRVEKIIEAGCDQFGGESRPELVIKLVEDGLISEGRIDASVRLLLREKFTLGLFENPFVDVEAAASIVGKADFREGDIALLRLKAPYEPRSGGFEAKFNAGSLEYSHEEKARQAAIFKAVSTIVDIHLDRPAAIPEIATSAAALTSSYGSSGSAFLDVVFGRASPEGKLPFDLPSSMKAVEESRSDMHYDTENPVFCFGHGLSYPSKPVN
ncbi:hypothetical protein VE02_02185 [Pseudogymnoascus sp. 03VT05]|nr:hypothetical protein VE02_02185 [Pseudogymnoascus sp. 03VT05]